MIGKIRKLKLLLCLFGLFYSVLLICPGHGDDESQGSFSVGSSGSFTTQELTARPASASSTSFNTQQGFSGSFSRSSQQGLVQLAPDAPETPKGARLDDAIGTDMFEEDAPPAVVPTPKRSVSRRPVARPTHPPVPTPEPEPQSEPTPEPPQARPEEPDPAPAATPKADPEPDPTTELPKTQPEAERDPAPTAAMPKADPEPESAPPIAPAADVLNPAKRKKSKKPKGTAADTSTLPAADPLPALPATPQPTPPPTPAPAPEPLPVVPKAPKGVNPLAKLGDAAKVLTPKDAAIKGLMALPKGVGMDWIQKSVKGAVTREAKERQVGAAAKSMLSQAKGIHAITDPTALNAILAYQTAHGHVDAANATVHKISITPGAVEATSDPAVLQRIKAHQISIGMDNGDSVSKKKLVDATRARIAEVAPKAHVTSSTHATANTHRHV